MNAATATATARPSYLPVLAGALAFSFLGHALLLVYLHFRPTTNAEIIKPVELVMVEVQKPPPPPEPPKEPEPPKPPPPIRVARPSKPPPPEKIDAPPPPNDAPPPEAPPKPVPLVVGISMSSTTSAGAFAAPVGNTLYGKSADKAENPQDVKAYSAPKYVPAYQADTQPEVVYEYKRPRDKYPEEAKRGDIEGEVKVRITIDTNGAVVSAKLLGGPGYGLNEAALQDIRKFKFRPATKNGEPVSTEIVFLFRFELED